MSREALDTANDIIGKHLPQVAAANDILASRFPGQAAANAALLGRGVRGGGVFVPARGNLRHSVDPRMVLKVSPLARAIADNAQAVKDAGGVVDINVWAGQLGAAGVDGAFIVGAYDQAGGDAVLGPAEAKGDTRAFLAEFVSGLEASGVSAELIAGTYQAAGGRLG